MSLLLVELVQVLFLLLILLALIRPLGGFMARVYQGERNLLSPLLAPVERLIYRISGVKQDDEMGWKRYAGSMLLFNLVLFAGLFVLLMSQYLLPLNPQKLPSFSWQLALNTAVSFTTNTNWQNYSGEQAASYLTQMVGFGLHNFVSAATGMAIVIALIRGFSRRRSSAIGNFWVDLTRGTLYILLPISLIAAILLVSQGVIQNFSDYKTVPLVQSTTVSQNRQLVDSVTIPMGPVASQEAIKELGTNGGGFFNANSAHPFENPTPLSNFVEILLILLIPASLTYTFGVMVGNTRQGWMLLGVMLFLWLLCFSLLQGVEQAGNPLVAKLGVVGGNLEGKEARFGMVASNLFTVTTTATSCGAVNSMHDSLTPIGGMIPLSLMLLGEIVFGGVGSGLYTMLAFAIIAVFVSGLMIGRTPEYLGKKIEAADVKLCAFYILVSAMLILGPAAWAAVSRWGTAGLANHGPHGLSEILYAFSSAAGNNGSAFAGYAATSTPANVVLGLVMLAGRFLLFVPVLALAGSLAAKKAVPVGSGSFPVHGLTFVSLLVGTILIVGLLTFFPAISLGPLAEHFLITMSGKLF